MTTFQKSIKYLTLVFAVCLTVFIVSIIFDVAIEIVDNFSGSGDKVVSSTTTYENIDSIKVDMGLGDVIVRVEGEELIIIANELLGFETKEQDGKLKIETGSKTWGSKGNASLEIIIPENSIIELLEIEVGVGKCTVSDLKAIKADFDMGVGNLEGSTLEIEDCKINFGIGDVELDFIGNVEDYSVILDKGLGSAKVSGEKYSESEFKNKSAKNKIDADCGVGAIEINFE